MRLKQLCSIATWTAAAFLLTAPAAVRCQPVGATPAPLVITMDEILQMAVTNDLDILIVKQNPIVDKFAIDALYASYDPAFTMNATHSYFANAGGVDQYGRATPVGAVSETTDYQPGLSGQLPFGTQYSFYTQPGLIEHQTGTFVGPGQNYDGSVGLNLKQPLLKNLWIDAPRWNIALARKTLQYDQLALRQQVMTVVNNVKAAYFTLIFDRQSVQVQADAVKLAQATASQQKKRVELGAAAPLDQRLAESQAATSEAALLQARQTVVQQENTLKSLVLQNLSVWNNVTLVPAEQLVAVPENPELAECWRTALAMRPDIQEAKVNLEKQRITVKYNYNQIFPELDLVGTFGRNGVGSSASAEIGMIRHGSAKFYTYGIDLTVPLDNIGARSTYKSAKATLQQVVLQMKKIENQAIIAIHNDVTAVQSDLLQIEATRQARVYAEDALTAEQTKLDHGKSTIVQVLQVQSNLTSARSAEIQALANYNIALEQLAFDEGIILERNRIGFGR